MIPESDGTRQAHARLECHVPTNAKRCLCVKMYENAALLDKPVIDVVASIAESTMCQEPMLQLHGCYQNGHHSPIIGATKPEHLSTAISALDFSLSDAEIMELEAHYLPHPVDGSFPTSGYATFTHTAFSNTGLLMPSRPGVAGSPCHSCPVIDVKGSGAGANAPDRKSSLHRFGPAVGDNEQLVMSGSDSGLVDLRLRPLSRSGSTICPIGSPLRLKTMMRPGLRLPHTHCLRCRLGLHLERAR